MTGQAQTGVSPTTGTSATARRTSRTAVCANLSGLFDCAQHYVNVQDLHQFRGANTSTPLDTNTGKMTVDVNNLPYAAGGPGSIVVVQLYYQWPICVSLLNSSLADINGNRLLVATAVFRNEPYQ